MQESGCIVVVTGCLYKVGSMASGAILQSTTSTSKLTSEPFGTQESPIGVLASEVP